jgi:hypothetical protein
MIWSTSNSSRLVVGAQAVRTTQNGAERIHTRDQTTPATARLSNQRLTRRNQQATPSFTKTPPTTYRQRRSGAVGRILKPRHIQQRRDTTSAINACARRGPRNQPPTSFNECAGRRTTAQKHQNHTSQKRLMPHGEGTKATATPRQQNKRYRNEPPDQTVPEEWRTMTDAANSPRHRGGDDMSNQQHTAQYSFRGIRRLQKKIVLYFRLIEEKRRIY